MEQARCGAYLATLPTPEKVGPHRPNFRNFHGAQNLKMKRRDIFSATVRHSARPEGPRRTWHSNVGEDVGDSVVGLLVGEAVVGLIVVGLVAVGDSVVGDSVGAQLGNIT